MHRTRFRGRSGGSSVFTPSQISFTSGLWLDPSDISTGFQDSAGTTAQTASGQPTGKRLDKSGLGIHVLQATGGARPEYTVAGAISSDWMDGTDDGYATAAFAAGALTADMDCFVAVKRATTANFMVLWGEVDTKYIGACNSASPGTQADGGAGASITYAVNGTAVAGGTGVTEAGLHAAVPVGSWAIVDVLNADLSAWTQLRHSTVTAYFTNGEIGGIIICPAQSDANRANIRRWLGRKVGLSL